MTQEINIMRDIALNLFNKFIVSGKFCLTLALCITGKNDVQQWGYMLAKHTGDATPAKAEHEEGGSIPPASICNLFNTFSV